MPVVDLCWGMDICVPRETKAYSFLASARGLGSRLCHPIYGRKTIGFLSETVNLFDQLEEISISIFCAGVRAVVQALYFCSPKVWNVSVLF